MDKGALGELEQREKNVLTKVAQRFESKNFLCADEYTNIVFHRTILFVKHGDKRSLIRGVGRSMKRHGLSDEEFFLRAECIRIEGGTEADV